jgi:hypothetical protein
VPRCLLWLSLGSGARLRQPEGALVFRAFGAALALLIVAGIAWGALRHPSPTQVPLPMAKRPLWALCTEREAEASNPPDPPGDPCNKADTNEPQSRHCAEQQRWDIAPMSRLRGCGPERSRWS